MISRFYRDRCVFAHLEHEVPEYRRLDLVLCRNVAFTYLASERQRSVLSHRAAVARRVVGW